MPNIIKITRLEKHFLHLLFDVLNHKEFDLKILYTNNNLSNLKLSNLIKVKKAPFLQKLGKKIVAQM